MNKEYKKNPDLTNVKVIEFLIGLLDKDVDKTNYREKMASIEKYPPEQRPAAHWFIYHEIWDILTKMRNLMGEEDLKYKILNEFSSQEPEGLLLLCFDEKKQFFTLAKDLTDHIYGRLFPLIGPIGMFRLLDPITKGTLFDALEIDKRLQWDRVQIVTVSEAVEVMQEILDCLYISLVPLIGQEEARAILEGYFYYLYIQYKSLPAIYDLLAAMPKGMLSDIRYDRLSSLEKLIDKNAKDLALSNEKLKAQTEILSDNLEKLKQANEEMKMLDAAKSDFIRVISHQFRTPLSVIRWNIDLLIDSLKKYDLKDTENEMLKDIKTEDHFLINTLERQFHCLAIEMGNLNMDMKPNFLWEIVQDAIEEHKEAMAKKNIKFSFNKEKEAIEQVNIDKEKMKEAFRIILDNSINYTPEGGSISVDISKEEVDSKPYLLLKFLDSGIGIAKEDLPKVFDKFFRGENAARLVPDGTGIGMYVIKNFMDRQGGAIKVISEKDKGCEVRLYFPIGKQTEKEERPNK